MDKTITGIATTGRQPTPTPVPAIPAKIAAPEKAASGNDQLRGTHQVSESQDAATQDCACRDNAPSTTKPAAQPHKTASNEELIGMMGRGAMMPLFVGATVYAPRAIARYRMVRAEHVNNPRAPMFRTSQEMKWPVIRNMYNPDTKIGKALENMYLPSQMKGQPITKADTDALTQSGAKVMAFSRSMGSLTTAGRLAVNAGGASAFTAQSRWQDQTILGMDSLALTGKFVENGAAAAGMKHLSTGAMEKSVGLLRVGRTGGFVGDGLFIATGAMRITDQLSRDDTKWSAVGYGIQDMTLGMVGVTQNAITMQQATAAKTIDRKISVLSGSVRMSTPLQMALRLANTAGASVNLAINARQLVNAATDRQLTEGQREEKIISGSLGVASATCLAAGSMLTLPVSMPIGLILIIGGGALGAAQLAYDYRRELFGSFDPDQK